MGRYFAALAKRDAEATADLLHFPFATYEGPEPDVVDTRDQFLSDPPKSMNVTGRGVNHIQAGAEMSIHNKRLFFSELEVSIRGSHDSAPFPMGQKESGRRANGPFSGWSDSSCAARVSHGS